MTEKVCSVNKSIFYKFDRWLTVSFQKYFNKYSTMEAVPRLPMISFQLKVSPEPTTFGPKLKQVWINYIINYNIYFDNYKINI